MNYNYLNPNKYFINKIWNDNIINNYEKGLNNLNIDFNKKLNYNYENNNNDFLSGFLQKNDFQEEYFGIYSQKRINNINFDSQDSFILSNINKSNHIFQLLESNNKSELKSNNIFNYIIEVGDEKLFTKINDEFNSTINYSVEFFDLKYKNIKILVKNPNISTDTIQFYSNKLIDKATDVSIYIEEEFYIIDIKNYGKIYDIILSEKLNFLSKELEDYKIYYQNSQLIVINNNINNNTLTISNINLVNFISNIKITKDIVISSYNYFKINFTIINFVNNNFDKFFFISKDDKTNFKTYIEINNIVYILNYDYDLNIFYIEDNVFNKTITNNLLSITNKNIKTNIFRLINFNEYNELTEEYALLECNRNFNNYLFDLQYDETMPINLNFNNTNIEIKKLYPFSNNKFYIKYNLSNDEEIINFKNKPIIHNYRMKQSIDYRINSIKPLNKFLYKIVNKFNFLNTDEILLDIDILYDFDTDELNNLRELKAEIYEITPEYIYIIVPYNEKLLEYKNDIIINNENIINDSFLNFYNKIDISQNVLKNNIVVKEFDSKSRLYLLFQLSDDIIYSHYYNLPDIIKLDNNTVNVNELFTNPNSLQLKFITELIGEYLWNSNDFFSFLTPLVGLNKNRELTVNYSLNKLNLSDQTNSNYYWGENSNNNLLENITSEDIKICRINGKNYGLIRNTINSNDYVNQLLPYNSSNDINMNLDIELKIQFPINTKYNFNVNEFNLSVSNITLSRLQILKTHENIVTLFYLLKNDSYSYKLVLSNDVETVITDILNVTFLSDKIIIDIDKNIIIDSNYFNSYELIENIKDFNIEKNEYFELQEIQMKEDLPIYLNQGDIFDIQIFWTDPNIKNLDFLNNYFIIYEDDIEWETTDNMNMIYNGNISIIKVISMIVFKSNNKYKHYLLFSSNENIVENITVDIMSFNWDTTVKINNVLEFDKYKMELYNKLSFYKYDELYSKLYLFSKFNDFNYTKYISNIEHNNFKSYDYKIEKGNNILVFRIKYNIIEIQNNSYNQIGLNKINDTIIKEVKTTTEYEDPIVKKDFQLHFFKSIDFLIDDFILEKLDAHMLKILYSFNFSIFKETTFDKIIRFRKEDNCYCFNFPLKFFFNTHHKFFPVCLTKKSKIGIKFNINKLSNLLENTGKMDKIVKPKMDILYTTYFLETNLINELKKNTEFMLVQNCYNYSSSILNNEIETVHPKIYNMVKDIFIVVEDVFLNSNEIYNRDEWYNQYVINYNIYLNNINDNKIEDYLIFKNIDIEVENNSSRIQFINNKEFFDIFDIKFILYLDDKFLNHIDEDLNNHTSIHSNKITILILYFKNIFKNERVNSYPNGFLDKIQIKLNGLSIIPKLSGKYYNDVIPYLKGYTLDDNHYVYSFGYNSKVKQPNGHLNLKLIDDFSLEIDKNSNVSKAKIKLYTKEYKILEINNNKINIIK